MLHNGVSGNDHFIDPLRANPGFLRQISGQPPDILTDQIRKLLKSV